MRHLILGTAGHVDHGKTALIKLLTGFDCDTHKEEKQRGITINLGFTSLTLPNGETLGIIDVPGHKDFISTMVGGASGMDMVMLVIAADSGIMPQTREHLQIIQALGIKKGVVALTRADLVDEEWLELTALEIQEFLHGTVLSEALVVPVSAVTGRGKDDLLKTLQSLVETVDEKEPRGRFRMYIDRIFSVRGFGSVVTGSVLGGHLRVNQEVQLQPGDHAALRVRSLERHGKPVDEVVGGDRAAINLIGLERSDFQRGMVITDQRLPETTRVDALVRLFDTGTSLSLWSHLSLHAATFECPVRMHLLNCDALRPTEEAIVQLHLPKPVVLLARDRFILRNSSGDRTLGGGFILDASPLHHRKRTEKLRNNLTSLAETMRKGDNIIDLVKAELHKECRPFRLDDIAGRLHMTAGELLAEVEAQTWHLPLFRADNGIFMMDPHFHQQYCDRVLAILKEHHRQYPVFADGLDLQEMAGKLDLAKNKQEKAFVALLLNGMEAEAQLEKKGNTWILHGHRAHIDEVMAGHLQWLGNAIRDYDVQKPVISELEEKALARKLSKHEFRMLMSYLVKTKKIVYFQQDFMHIDIVNKYRMVLLKLVAEKPEGIEINVFKEAIQASKRLCAMLAGVYEAEKIIRSSGSGVETNLFITEEGKKVLRR